MKLVRLLRYIHGALGGVMEAHEKLAPELERERQEEREDAKAEREAERVQEFEKVPGTTNEYRQRTL